MVDTMFDGVNTNLNLGSAKAQTDWTPRFGPFLMRQFPVVSVCLSSSGCLEGSDAGRPEADRRRSLQRAEYVRTRPGIAIPSNGPIHPPADGLSKPPPQHPFAENFFNRRIRRLGHRRS